MSDVRPAPVVPLQNRRYRWQAVSLHVLLALLTIGVYVFLYSPLFVTALFSFNEGTATVFPIEEFSLHWYRELFQDGGLWSSFRNSILVGALAVCISLVVGTVTAFLLDRVRLRGASMLSALMLLPFVVPGILTGLSLALFFYWLGVSFSLLTVAVGHVTFVTPVVFFLVRARLQRLDRDLEKASMDLGANRSRTLWHVTLPSIRLALVAATLLGFTLSFDEVIITYFLVGDKLTLPMEIWIRIRFGFTPEINAIFTIIVVGSVVTILIATLLSLRLGRHRPVDLNNSR
jgi:spermidine/putrescine transport system permease protein